MTSSSEVRDCLLQDHVRLNALAADLRTLLSLREPPDIARFRTLRWAFASNLMQHLATKERHIYAKLQADERPELRSLHLGSTAQLSTIFDAYVSHMDAWPTGLALCHWPSYRPLATAVLEDFMSFFAREELELFDALSRFPIDIATPTPLISSWARRAFEIKAKVDDWSVERMESGWPRRNGAVSRRVTRVSADF